MATKTTKSSSKKQQKKPKFDRNEMLLRLEKALDSHVLNGGFDTLFNKVDQIERCQEHMTSQQKQIANKVESIHDAIYDPDDGIYSRIKTLNAQQQTSGAEMNIWKRVVEDQLDEDKDLSKENNKDIMELRTSIDGIEKFRKNIAGVLKWLSVAIIGGIITLALKTGWSVLF